MKKTRNTLKETDDRDALGDVPFAITVLAMASCSLIILALIVTLWLT
ncbi:MULTISPECIES: hypothetical protein [Gibbsiella]|nr:hypothetical protein [Gibbsiella quercinecans]